MVNIYLLEEIEALLKFGELLIWHFYMPFPLVIAAYVHWLYHMIKSKYLMINKSSEDKIVTMRNEKKKEKGP